MPGRIEQRWYAQERRTAHMRTALTCLREITRLDRLVFADHDPGINYQTIAQERDRHMHVLHRLPQEIQIAAFAAYKLENSK